MKVIPIGRIAIVDSVGVYLEVDAPHRHIDSFRIYLKIDGDEVSVDSISQYDLEGYVFDTEYIGYGGDPEWDEHLVEFKLTKDGYASIFLVLENHHAQQNQYQFKLITGWENNQQIVLNIGEV